MQILPHIGINGSADFSNLGRKGRGFPPPEREGREEFST
jgi:hypothetical protein